MDPIQNPYQPGAGTQPPELAGREDLLRQATIILNRTKNDRAGQSLILTGLRGVGKTVLLNRIREIADGAGCMTVLVEAQESQSLPALLIPSLRKLLLDLDRMGELGSLTKRAIRALASFMQKQRLSAKFKLNELAELELGVAPEIGVADSGNLELDLQDLFVEAAKAGKEKGRPICLLIDEIQYLKERDLSALILALHQVSQRSLPLVLIAAGLPIIVGLTGRAKSYAERLFQFPAVGQLPAEDARRAILAPAEALHVSFTDDALAAIVSETKGYPYFLQQWGYDAWNAAPRSPITAEDVNAGRAEAIRKLDSSFFRMRFDRLTPREREYLYAMLLLRNDPLRTGEIADKLGASAQSVAPVRASLIRKGMIYSPAHGDVAFTVPLFSEFLLRERRSAS